MHHFAYRAGVMHAEAVDLTALAEAVGTPFYCYSTATLERHYHVFAQAFRQAARYDASRGPVAAWLLMMARSRSIDRVRSRRSRPETQTSDDARAMDEMPGSMPDAASSMLDQEQARIVQRALGALPTIQRVAIELAYYDGLSHREIAERLEEPLGTVKTRIRLGLLKLRDALREARL